MAKSELLGEKLDDRQRQRIGLSKAALPDTDAHSEILPSGILLNKLGQDFGRRMLTALIGGPIVVGAVYFGGVYFYLLLGVVWIGSLLELRTMIRPGSMARWALFMVGALYVGIPLILIAQVRDLPRGTLWLVLLLLANWATDGFALIGGRIWGHTKLAPQISPGKTVEGVLIGLISGVIVTVAIGMILLDMRFIPTLILGLLIGFLTVIGDLFESLVKRQFNIKHTGGVLPGHGGLLDRLDGLVLAVIGMATFLLLR